MPASKQLRTSPRKPQPAVGLLAIGTCGPWEISVDQAISGRPRWFAQIEGPSVYLYFEIRSLNVVGEAARLLSEETGGLRAVAANGKPNGPLTLGKDKSAPVRLLRDDEFEDRYFLVVEAKNGAVARFTIAGNDRAQLADCLRQINVDIAAQ